MKTVAFLTDLHFDIGSRWQETLRISDWCVQLLSDRRPDVIAIGGDWYEKRPQPIEVRAVAEWCVQLAEIAPVLGVYGNHDVPDSLAPMNMLKSKHPIRIFDRPESVSYAGLKFAMMPWPRKAGLLAELGPTSSLEASAVAAKHLQNILRGLGEQSPDCFVGHVQVRGAKVSTGQPLAPGADFELGLEDLALARARAYLLGHIHLPDLYEIAGSPALYGGSFRRTAYGETEEKYLTIASFSSDRVSIDRLPIPCTPMQLISVEWKSGQLTTAQRALPGAEIRLRVRVPADERVAARAAADEWRFAALEAGALSVKLEEDVVVTKRARAPQVAAAISIAEKLSAHWQSISFHPGERKAALVAKANELHEEQRRAS